MPHDLSALDMEYEWLIPVFIGIAMFTLGIMFLKYVVLSSNGNDDEDENENKDKENNKVE
ncbi:hypothetical protein MNBD_GAMMA16-209 [hydrothermal vent metagenome]|uniref:Uncharacterized protein n=1 Tax=hydrothermal vent metagenome TaxID=652676 RepID=A0A3B0Z8Z3_9ZZZZ